MNASTILIDVKVQSFSQEEALRLVRRRKGNRESREQLPIFLLPTKLPILRLRATPSQFLKSIADNQVTPRETQDSPKSAVDPENLDFNRRQHWPFVLWTGSAFFSKYYSLG
jgi:hypothetical protein